MVRTAGGKAFPLSLHEVERVPLAFDVWKYDTLQSALVKESKDIPVLWFKDGELWTRNPDDATVADMIWISDHIGARVRGDELETYRSATETYIHPEDIAKKAKADEMGRALVQSFTRNSFLLNVAIFGSFALLVFALSKLALLERCPTIPSSSLRSVARIAKAKRLCSRPKRVFSDCISVWPKADSGRVLSVATLS